MKSLRSHCGQISHDGRTGKVSEVRIKAFRVPLHPKNGKIPVGDCLRTEIQGATLYDLQAGADPADGLMVGAVDYSVSPAQMMQPGSLFNDGGVILVAVIIFVQIGGGKILYHSSAQPYIYDLHPLTDAEDGLLTPQKQIEGLKL